MSFSHNYTAIGGNLTRDPELRSVGKGQVAKFGLAVNRKYRNAAGELQEEVTFVECEAWGRTAETMAQYLQKGSPVFIEGRLKFDSWEDKEGKRQSKLYVVCNNFQFVSGPRREGEAGDAAPRSEPVPKQTYDQHAFAAGQEPPF